MKFKQLLSLLLAAMIFAFGLTAFAETAESEDYTPVDISEYTRWDGESDFKSGTNYYIDQQVDICKKTERTLPADSRLVIREGAELRIFVGSSLNLRGELLIEPNGIATISGTVYAPTGSKIDNRGSFVLTPNALVNLHSALDSVPDSSINCGGTLKIYKSGALNNCGKTTIQSESVVTVTGAVTVPENGQMFMRGQLLLTLSGTMDVSGYLSLSGEIHNSGTLDLQEQSKYYVYDNGKLLRSPSGRFNDHRRITASDVHQSSSSSSEKAEFKGIDVSRYQNGIDWDKVADSGVEFAMIRLSLGHTEDKYNGQDTYSDYNIKEANRVGIHVGVYHYMRAQSVEEARLEAQFMIGLLGNYEIDYPIALDFEEPWLLKNLTNAERTEMILAFFDEIEKAGYYPMLYTSTSWLLSYLDMDKLSDAELWIADWRGYCGYDGDYGMWQYSPKSRVSGIDGDVDADICYKDYAKIIREGGYNHLS